MKVENEFLTCVEKLEFCVKNIKSISRKLEDLSNRAAVADDIFKIEESVENIKHALEMEIKNG